MIALGLVPFMDRLQPILATVAAMALPALRDGRKSRGPNYPVLVLDRPLCFRAGSRT